MAGNLGLFERMAAKQPQTRLRSWGAGSEQSAPSRGKGPPPLQ
jgi:hypothetical protein